MAASRAALAGEGLVEAAGAWSLRVVVVVVRALGDIADVLLASIGVSSCLLNDRRREW